MPEYEDLDLPTADGLVVKGYYIPPPRGGPGGRRTLLYLHANAGNMGHRLPIARELQRRLDCHVVMLSYRGYGLSPGSPSERGLKLDAQAALDWIQAENRLVGTKVLLYGQSIGGAVAIHLAASNPITVHGLVLENTFTSLPALIPAVMPALARFTFLCHQRWHSIEAIKRLARIPVLLLSGARDELVPPAHMQALHDQVHGQREGPPEKRAVTLATFPHGAHNDTCLQPGYFECIQSFVQRSQL